MADRLTKRQRSDLMRRIAGSNTLPERLIARELEKHNIDYVRNDKDLPGTPDIAIHARRVAVFIHGCFWHGCPLHYREPGTRQVFWRQKLARTKARDRRARISLRSAGWEVVTLWEHEARRSPQKAVARILEARARDLPKPGSGKEGSLLRRLRRL